MCKEWRKDQLGEFLADMVEELEMKRQIETLEAEEGRGLTSYCEEGQERYGEIKSFGSGMGDGVFKVTCCSILLPRREYLCI